MAMAINDCTPDMATDMTGMMKVTIDTQGLDYVPPCVRVKAGADVTWNSNFMIHPLVGGVIEGVMKKPDANSPIKPVSSGMSVTYKLANAGVYGFYCDVHGPAGMRGAVFVE
jgi:plastocyanin